MAYMKYPSVANRNIFLVDMSLFATLSFWAVGIFPTIFYALVHDVVVANH